MTVLGINVGSTLRGKPLHDGGAAMLSSDGLPLMAIAEERLSRTKHQGGSARSIDYCLAAAGFRRPEVDLCIATSCCEPVRDRASSVAELVDAGFPVDVVGHHDAHAYSAFWPSAFGEAIVVVMDCGGNTLIPDSSGQWWAYGREQTSYYVGFGSDIALIGRDFDLPFDLGFGEAFRAVTHYLGWPSSTFAGNTMALSALGDGKLAARPLWTDRAGKLKAAVDMGDPHEPLRLASRMLAASGVDDIRPRTPGGRFSQAHKNVAQWLQLSFYDALRTQVGALVARTGIRKICFAGGVALNCVAIGQLVQDGVVDDVFVQPAAGDTGQCLGAAYSAYHRLGGSRSISGSPFNTFLGRKYSDSEVEEALKLIEANGPNISFLESPDAVAQVAGLVAAGRTVAWFSGRSEFGPRALGGRSIVADPRDKDVKKRLIQIKDRAWFLPFAPSVLDDAASCYFEGQGSAHMTVAVPVRDAQRPRIPGVIHEDGTARVQIVPGRSESAFADLLRKFGTITGDAMMLNTSLNLRGEPMAETPMDAARIFLRSEIDCIFLDGIVAVKD